MTGNTLGWVIVAFVLYLLMMIAIGAFYAKGNNNSEDYFLGGRKLNGFVAALSAQASDMSGWLLMGLPGAIYLTGVGGDGWIAIGLFIGTTLNWLFIATKLRRYTIRANNSVTLPTYFENRFHDEKKVLMAVSSITIVVFFLVYCASALSAGGQLFESVFGIDYHVALTIGAGVRCGKLGLGGDFRPGAARGCRRISGRQLRIDLLLARQWLAAGWRFAEPGAPIPFGRGGRRGRGTRRDGYCRVCGSDTRRDVRFHCF